MVDILAEVFEYSPSNGLAFYGVWIIALRRP